MPETSSDIVVVFVGSSLFIALLVISMFLFLLAYQKRNALQRMHMKEMENNYHLELLNAAVEVQERERKRIASDLHDDVGALLSALKFNVMHLEDLPGTGEQQRLFLGKTRQMLESGIDNVRQISYNLLPPTLARFGFKKAVHEWIRALNEAGTVRIVFEPGNVPERLPEQTELALFRIVQELVSNSLKHARATSITLATNLRSDRLLLTYCDDGCGFNSDAKHVGLGLKNIQSRARTLNGTITMEAPAGRGFSATLDIPYSITH